MAGVLKERMGKKPFGLKRLDRRNGRLYKFT